MTTSPHADYSEAVKTYFAQTGNLPIKVINSSPDLIGELIDAVDDPKLIDALKGLLRREGVI